MSATGKRLRGPGLFLLWCGLAGPALAQDRPSKLADLPAIERERPGFYGAIDAGGGNVSATWSLSASRVPRNGEVILTLSVRGAINPLEIRKPDLKNWNSLREQVQILDISEEGEIIPAKEARFRYRLRPRTAGAITVPAFRFVFYRPGLAEGKRFQTTYAEPVSFQVIEPASVIETGSVSQLPAPAWFRELRSEDSPYQRLGPLGLLLLSLAFMLSGALLRYCSPRLGRMSRLRQNREVRIALDQLALAHRSNDPARTTVETVRNYLIARHGLPSSAQTPAEIAEELTAQGKPEKDVEAFASLLRACDEARFSPTVHEVKSLPPTARHLIITVEERSA